MRRLIFCALMAALALTGGASRADEPLAVLAPLSGLAALAAGLWPLDISALQRRPVLVAFAATCVLLPLLQLLPLPPDIWASLPGHRLAGDVARATGTVVWRPASLTPDLTREALLALIPPAAALLAALFLDRRDLPLAAQAVLAVALASALLGLAQAALGDGAPRLYRVTTAGAPVGLMANRNHQAALMALALPLAATVAGLAMRADRRLRAGAVLAMAAPLALALATSGSRMGILLGLVGAGAALGCWRACGLPLWPAGRPARLWLPAAAIGLAALLAVALSRTGTLGRIAATDAAGELRAQSLGALIETARAFMPTGAGFGSFNPVYRAFEPDALLSTIYLNEAHCEPLQLAIEGGLPALLLLAVFTGWWLRTVVAAGRNLALPRPVRAQALAHAGVTLILMLSSLVDYPLRTPLLSAVFVASCITLGRLAGQRATA